jgi:NADPH-dependent ferric siderophore reductase
MNFQKTPLSERPVEHQITRHRHELKRRRLIVKEKTRITPDMIRVLFEGDGLSDFISLAPDDHVKLFFLVEAGGIERRDYTPRHFDQVARTLAIDFAVHDAGPATRWAIEAKPGDVLEIGGPRGSAVVSPTFDWWLLVGDETALPAIGRRIEELPGGARVISVVTVADAREEQTFTTSAQHNALWVHRPVDRANDPAPLLSALETIALLEGDGFVWIAAEARVARAVRDYLVNARGHPLAWMKAAGYWLKGVSDAHDKLES